MDTSETLHGEADQSVGHFIAPISVALAELLAVAATPAAVGTFAFVRVIARLAPEPRQDKTSDRPLEFRSGDACQSPHVWSRRIVALFVCLYQESLLRRQLKKKGYYCRFIPTCTEYAIRAAEKHGLLHGLALTGDRFRRCSPTYEGSHIDFP